MAWAPNPTYTGVHGDLPFADPWWKILAIIVAIVAAIVAIIAAALGAGKANFSVGGTFEETEPSVHCCTPKGAASGKPEYTVAGVASAIASVAIAVACSDAADPFFRADSDPTAARRKDGGRKGRGEMEPPQCSQRRTAVYRRRSVDIRAVHYREHLYAFGVGDLDQRACRR